MHACNTGPPALWDNSTTLFRQRWQLREHRHLLVPGEGLASSIRFAKSAAHLEVYAAISCSGGMARRWNVVPFRTLSPGEPGLTDVLVRPGVLKAG